MTTVTMVPQHLSNFHFNPPWSHNPPEQMTRPRDEMERTLPPIRQAFPELQWQASDLQRDRLPRTPPLATSPTEARSAWPVTPPEYIVSPNRSKRMRLSIGEENEFIKASQVPRPYAGLSQAPSRPQSPAPNSRPSFRPWVDWDRTSPRHNADNKSFPPLRSPASINVHERAETRPTLPSLAPPNLEPASIHKMRHAGDEYMLNSSRRPSLVHNNTHCVDGGGHGYQPASFDYGYHHPNRAQSLSAGSAHFDRASIGPAAYEHPFPESYMRYGNFGMTSHGDGKRKRRGNLPKETTDKLRAWFHAHLTHPYPTEDEKQEFMRRTGLQMNQISNWFINARRRHLPGILNDARAESNAMNSHTTDGGSNALPPNEPTDYDHEGSEESNYDDAEVESAKGGSTTEIERGST